MPHQCVAPFPGANHAACLSGADASCNSPTNPMVSKNSVHVTRISGCIPSQVRTERFPWLQHGRCPSVSWDHPLLPPELWMRSPMPTTTPRDTPPQRWMSAFGRKIDCHSKAKNVCWLGCARSQMALNECRDRHFVFGLQGKKPRQFEH